MTVIERLRQTFSWVENHKIVSGVVTGLITAGIVALIGALIVSDRLPPEPTVSDRLPPEPTSYELARKIGFHALLTTRQDGWHVSYSVRNRSGDPISDVVLVVDDSGREGDASEQMGTAYEVVLGVIPAKEHLKDDAGPITFLGREPSFFEASRLTGLLFTDTRGQSWYTDGREWLRKDHPAITD